MKRRASILWCILIIVTLGVLGALGFAYSGIYNVAADEPHWPITRWLLETTRVNSIQTRLDRVEVPDGLDREERRHRGAISYAAMCQSCHLAPGVEPTPLSLGLNPRAPGLAGEERDYTPEYLFWATKHGIKMTGMPAWGETHEDEQLWDLVAFMLWLPELSEEDYAELVPDTPVNDHGHDH